MVGQEAEEGSLREVEVGSPPEGVVASGAEVSQVMSWNRFIFVNYIPPEPASDTIL